MSFSGSSMVVDSGPWDVLLSHLRGLDQWQLAEFKLGLQAPQRLAGRPQKVPWADVKGASPADLLCLLKEHFPGRQGWDVALQVFEDMNLTSVCEELRAQMNEVTQAPQDPRQEEPEVPENQPVHTGLCRGRMKAKVLAMWSHIPVPEDHIYLRNVAEQEHEELQRLLCPKKTGAQPGTIVLHGGAGVGKTTLATKVLMHWAEGLLFPHRFSYVSYISCHRVREMGDTTFIGLLSGDSPDSQVPVEYLMRHPEKLLVVIDGFEEMTVPSDVDDRLARPDWSRQLPAARILLHVLKKELVPAATLLITTRDQDSEDLRKRLLNPWFVRIPGFTEGDQEEYFFRYFGDRAPAGKALRWVRTHETLARACCAPLLCWAVCSCLKRQMARRPPAQLGTQTTTGLYARFFSGVLETAEVSWSPSWPGQWRALCSLAAAGLWSANATFAKGDMPPGGLRAPLGDGLFRLNILRKAGDCEDCVTFTHPSFQVFLGAMFYVLRGPEGATGGLPKHREMRVLLDSAFTDANSYWHPLVLFLFGLLNRDLAGEVEDALRCELCPRTAEELLRWAGGLSTWDAASCGFAVLPLLRCLYETQEEAWLQGMLGHLRQADLDLGEPQLRAAAFCLKHCRRLRKLRLSVSCHVSQTEAPVSRATPRARRVNSKMHQWQDVCSVFHNGHLKELDLSNSKLSAASMKTLCYQLRNPRCQLQKLTCRSVTPVRVLKELVLVLYGNSRLTHLNLSSNNLGGAVSTMIFQTLRHSACNLQYLWLESCGLTPTACHRLCLELSKNASLRFLSLAGNDLSDVRRKTPQKPFEASQGTLKELSLEKCNLSATSVEALASVLTSPQRTTRLCLAFNPLQDHGVRQLCASLRQPGCALERLVLCFCQLGPPSGRYLSDALLRNKSLTHLNLRKNQLGDEGVRLLCEALRQPGCVLQSLDVSDCSFAAEGCRELAAALSRNRSLTALDIGRNRVQDAGGRRLCEALKRSGCALSTLGLEKCSLTSACCRPLSSLLRSRRSPVNLNLIGNDLGPVGISTLWTSLKKSTCKLQKLGLEKDLRDLVTEKLKDVCDKGCSLRVLCQWDSNDPDDKWWW